MTDPARPAGIIPVRKREIVGYCMFDFANSSYTTLITTVAYALYFKEVVAVNSPNGDFLWSAAKSLAMVVLILTSPVFGALADQSGRKKAFLFFTTAMTITACAALWFVTPGALFLGMLLYVIGTIGFEGGYVFYNAFLPEISTPKTLGRISGWSWGTGFLGGLVALVVCYPFLARPLRDPSGVLIPESVSAWRFSFVIVLFLRERAIRQPIRPMGRFVVQGFHRVASTFRHLRRYRDAASLIASSFFFYGAIQTIIAFSAIYARSTLGMGMEELLTLMVVSNLVAVPGTLLAGYLADWIGMKKALISTLLFWFVLLIFGALITSKTLFWFMAGGVAIGMGSTQAISRSFMAKLSPAEKESEFFGFYIFAGQAGAIFSLMVFGFVSSYLGGQRWAVLVTAPAFLVATFLAFRINENDPASRQDTP
jgi:UMF1 family MFS transporter